MAKVNLGDVIVFNWSGTDFPKHAAVATQVTADGSAATHGFAAWEDTMTFHEVDLRTYNGGVLKNIIGFGSLAGIVGLDALESYRKAWEGRAVAPEWDGSKGNVCIDGVTSIDGYGGEKLRSAMRADFKAHRRKYRNFGAGEPNPAQDVFFRRLGWLVQFFKNTGRYADVFTGK